MQRRRTDHARRTLHAMRGARDRAEVVGIADLALRFASGCDDLALDLGQGLGIVAEQLDQPVTVVRRDRALAHVGCSTRASFSQTSRVARNCSIPIGLVISPSMPTARLRRSWSSKAL